MTTRTTLLATFSNGSTDTYKGKRPVTAAWAIIRKSDGALLSSGHSLDAEKARKTAEGNFRYVAREAGAVVASFDKPRTGYPQVARYWDGVARKCGFADWKAAYAAYQADLARARENVTIEVVAI